MDADEWNRKGRALESQGLCAESAGATHQLSNPGQVTSTFGALVFLLESGHSDTYVTGKDYKV